MNSTTFTALGALKFGWETFKKRPSFLIGVAACVGLIIWVTSIVSRGSFILSLVQMLIGILVGMGLVAFALKAERDVKEVTFNDLWHPQPFFSYLGAVILTGLCVVVGLVLLIVPGLIAISMFAFVKYIIIDRNLGPIEAMKESMRITKGKRWEVLFLVILLAVINILGFLAVFIGLLFTIPVSILAVAHAYRVLEKTTENSSEAAA